MSDERVIAGNLLRGLERCPHSQCGTANPTLTYRHFLYDELDQGPLVRVWVSYICASCGNIVAAMVVMDRKRVQTNFKAHLLSGDITVLSILPEARSVDSDVPAKPRRYLEQALQSLKAPDGAIMLAGSAVDAMLQLKGYDDGSSVYGRINKAVKDHVLTAEMGEWAHSVRLESNKPRHADLDEPHATADQADQSVRFAEALAEYLFALPARVQRGRAASQEAGGGPST